MEFNKIYSATCTGSTWNLIKYVSFLRPPAGAAQALHSNVCYRLQKKTILTSRFHLCPPDPTIPFKLCMRRFPIIITFLRHSVRLKVRRLNVLQNIHHRLYFPWPVLGCFFPNLFIGQHRCCIDNVLEVINR